MISIQNRRISNICLDLITEFYIKVHVLLGFAISNVQVCNWIFVGGKLVSLSICINFSNNQVLKRDVWRIRIYVLSLFIQDLTLEFSENFYKRA